MASTVWQTPFVDVFKHVKIDSWFRAEKSGDVVAVMDKTIGRKVFHLRGSVPAANYIQMPKSKSQSLGLIGRFIYIQLKLFPDRFFTIHVDIMTADGLSIRVSLSNLFKEFKSSTSTLQFPYTANDDPRWTLLVLDAAAILRAFTTRDFQCVKGFQLCANMLIRNIYTSNEEYRREDLPREMALPVAKGQAWNDKYNYVRFPDAEEINEPPVTLPTTVDVVKHPPHRIDHSMAAIVKPRKDVIRPPLQQINDTSAASARSGRRPTGGAKVKGAGATEPPRKQKHDLSSLPSDLPNLEPDMSVAKENVSITTGQSRSKRSASSPNSKYATEVSREGQVDRFFGEKRHSQERTLSAVFAPVAAPPASEWSILKPDPILHMSRVIGYTGELAGGLTWNSDATEAVFTSQSVIIAMNLRSSEQRYFVGHTDAICAMSFTLDRRLLATGQRGPDPVVRIWDYKTACSLAVLKAHYRDLTTVAISNDGQLVCGVGREEHGRQIVAVWDTSRVSRGTSGMCPVICRVICDPHIKVIKFSPFNDNRLVSCGRDNIRFWRFKNGTLRGCPVALGESNQHLFTDLDFEFGISDRDPTGKRVFVSTASGYVFQVDYNMIALEYSYHLHNGGINAISVVEGFCVTGSDDTFLRVWPLDFSAFLLEAQHEAPVMSVAISYDCLRILAGTDGGNMGTVDITSKTHQNYLHSHTNTIYSVAMDPHHRQFTTVSEDRTIRIWDLNSYEQLYEFPTPEASRCVVYHPEDYVLAVGFDDGWMRVLDIEALSAVYEYKQHEAPIFELAYNAAGSLLYTAGGDGVIVMYDAGSQYHPLRMCTAMSIGRRVALSLDYDGRMLAFIGPTPDSITIADADDFAVRKQFTAGAEVTKMMFAPRSVELIVSTVDSQLLRIDSGSGEVLSRTPAIHKTECEAIAVSDNGQFIVTGGHDHLIKVWDYYMRGPPLFQAFIGHSDAITRCCFSADQRSIVSVGVGDAVFVWNFKGNFAPEFKEKSLRLLEKMIESQFDASRPAEFVPPHVAEARARFNTLANAVKQACDAIMEQFSYDAPEASKEVGTVSVQASDLFKRAATSLALGDRPGAASLANAGLSLVRGLLGRIRQAAAGIDSARAEVVLETADRVADIAAALREVIAYITSPPSPRAKMEQALMAGGFVTESGTNISFDQYDVRDGTAERFFQPSLQPAKRFVARPRIAPMASQRYEASPESAALDLRQMIGYNGAGHSNVVWNPLLGVVAYACGSTLILEHLASRKQRHLWNHPVDISTLALHPDGSIIASGSGSADQEGAARIFLWDAANGDCLMSLAYHEHGVQSLAFSDDGRLLVSIGAYEECSVAVWDMDRRVLLASATTQTPMHEAKWDPNGKRFVTAGHFAIAVFEVVDDIIDGNVQTTLRPFPFPLPDHLSKASFTAVEMDARHGKTFVYVGGMDGFVSAWDLESGYAGKPVYLGMFNAGVGEIVVLKRGGTTLLTGGTEPRLRSWALPEAPRVATEGVLTEEIVLDGGCRAIVCDGAGSDSIVATNTNTLWYVNWTEASSIRLVSSHVGPVHCCAFDASERFTATGGCDGSLRLWAQTEEDSQQLAQFQVTAEECLALDFAPPGPTGTEVSLQCAGGYSDGAVRIFDLTKLSIVNKYKVHNEPITAICYADAGRVIITGSSVGEVILTAAATGDMVGRVAEHVTAGGEDDGGPTIVAGQLIGPVVDSVAVSPIDPSLWLIATRDRRVSIWRSDWRRAEATLVDWLTFAAPIRGPSDYLFPAKGPAFPEDKEPLPPSLACFSPVEKDMVLYTGYAQQKDILFFSLHSKRVLRTIVLHQWATCMDVSATGYIAIGTNDRLVKLIDYKEGTFQDYQGHSDGVRGVRFSRSGSSLLSTGHGDACLWEVKL